MNGNQKVRSEKAVSRQSEDHNSGNEFSLDVLAILNRRKLLIFLACILGLMVGGAYYLYLPPSYESEAQLLLMQNDSGAMASSVSKGESISEDLLATHMSLLQSKLIVGEALKRGGLTEQPSIIEKLNEKTTATSYVIDNMSVTRGGAGSARDARILTLGFRHSSPEDCQLVVTAIVAEYRMFVESKFKDINEEAVALINKARTELEDQIEKSASKYREFKNTAPILSSVAGGPNIYAQRYDELSAQLSQLQVTIDESKGRLELVKSGLQNLTGSEGRQLEKLALIDERNAERLGILVTVDRGEAQTATFLAQQPQRMAGATAEFSSLLALKAQLKQASKEYGAKHPEVRTLQTQVAEMEDYFKTREATLGTYKDEKPLTPDDVMKAYVSLMENDVLALDKRKLDLEKQIAEAEGGAKTLISVELEDEARLRELTRHEDLYNSVVERLRDINMQQDSTALIQEVIASPELGEKVSPSGPIAAAISLLTTLLAAGSLVLVAELRDHRIRATEDLEGIYDARVLGQIPDFDSTVECRRQVREATRSNSGLSPALFTFHAPQSRVSEIFRGMRTQILFDLSGTNKLLAVTSPNQGDGKSTITANLAISLAKTSKTVLLIDCDMRRPSIHSVFGIANEAGLVEVLRGSRELADVTVDSECEHLSILPTGQIPPDPAEMLTSETFAHLLETLRQKFDYVILDCPPLLPVSDPAIVAPLVDRVLLVTGVNASGIPEAEQCNRILSSVAARLAGIIVNRAGLPSATYGYGYTQYEYQGVPAAKAESV